MPNYFSVVPVGSFNHVESKNSKVSDDLKFVSSLTMFAALDAAGRRRYIGEVNNMISNLEKYCGSYEASKAFIYLIAMNSLWGQDDRSITLYASIAMIGGGVPAAVQPIFLNGGDRRLTVQEGRVKVDILKNIEMVSSASRLSRCDFPKRVSDNIETWSDYLSIINSIKDVLSPLCISLVQYFGKNSTIAQSISAIDIAINGVKSIVEVKRGIYLDEFGGFVFELEGDDDLTGDYESELRSKKLKLDYLKMVKKLIQIIDNMMGGICLVGFSIGQKKSPLLDFLYGVKLFSTVLNGIVLKFENDMNKLINVAVKKSAISLSDINVELDEANQTPSSSLRTRCLDYYEKYFLSSAKVAIDYTSEEDDDTRI